MKHFMIVCGLVLWTYSSLAQNTSSYRNPNKSEKVKVQADTILYKWQYEALYQELMKLRQENVSLEQTVRSLEKRVAQSDKVLFLDVQDTTIFGSKFQKIPMREIPNRSRDFYLLVQEIHDLNFLLTKIENMNISQLSSAGNQLTEARRLIDEINSFATLEKRKITDFLSEEQKQFFRNLVKRYNKLNGSLNHNSQGLNNE